MFTIEDLRQGKCAVINDGTLEELHEVLKLAFPDDEAYLVAFRNYDLFFASNLCLGEWEYGNKTILPTQSVKDFINKELKRGNLVWVSNKDPNEKARKATFIVKADGAKYPYITVALSDESSYRNGEEFTTNEFKYATKVEEPKEVEMTIEEIEKALNIKNLKIVK